MHKLFGTKSRNAFRFAVLLTLLVIASSLVINKTSSQGRMPDTIVLAKDAKLGQVTFNHAKHATENRSADLSKPIACVDCHHTAQPEAEAAKVPLHKTAYPADRTTTLTMDLLASDPKAVGAVCTDCHARNGEKPKLLPEIPSVTYPGASEPTVMTNQQAFHHKCGDCHDAVAKVKADTTAPTSKKCTACH
ncbi:MAG TPA: cytochrome c3 family protein, partial [Pyrinomonadaceae bacterium]|nr:cytochrome c3 family protein [Pyrinomonadaceae bacterium]